MKWKIQKVWSQTTQPLKTYVKQEWEKGFSPAHRSNFLVNILQKANALK